MPSGTGQEAAAGTAAELEAQRQAQFDASLEALLPVGPDEVRRYLDTRESLEDAASPDPATLRTRTRTLEDSLARSPEVVRLTAGYASTLLFQDVTGAPWPVLSVTLGNAQAFQVHQPRVEAAPHSPKEGSGKDSGESSGEDSPHNVHSHMVTLVPLSGHASSNLVVSLEGANYPVVLHLVTASARSKNRINDALTVFRLQRPGPAARQPLVGPVPCDITDELLAFVHGVPPKGARQVRTQPEDRGLAIWRYNNRFYVRTVYQAVWPAWSQIASAEGLTLYVMPPTPALVLTREGRRVTYVCEQAAGSGGAHGQ